MAGYSVEATVARKDNNWAVSKAALTAVRKVLKLVAYSVGYLDDWLAD